MSTEYDLIAHRKWALEFLAQLNPGKPFDGDVFEDADALVAYVVNGRQRPKVDAAQAIADVLAQRALHQAPEQQLTAPHFPHELIVTNTFDLDVNTGLAQ